MAILSPPLASAFYVVLLAAKVVIQTVFAYRATNNIHLILPPTSANLQAANTHVRPVITHQLLLNAQHALPPITQLHCKTVHVLHVPYLIVLFVLIIQ